VFALYAEGLPGWNLNAVGIALARTGLHSAFLQLRSVASDRVGRKPG